MVVPPEDTDRPRGILSASDREALLAGREKWEETHSRSAYTQRERAIRERTREALRDFKLLADELDAEEREKIFAAVEDPRDEEYGELHDDVEKAIKFFYVGMGGESGFRVALENGVRTGELELGNISHGFDVVPRFAVDTVRRKDERAVLEAIENKEWEKLTSPPALLAFIKTAVQAGAIDFETVSERIDFDEYVLETGDAIQEFNRRQQSDATNDE